MFFNPDIFNSETRTQTTTYDFPAPWRKPAEDAMMSAGQSPDAKIHLTIECIHEENQFVEAFVSRVVWPSAKLLGEYFCAPDRARLVQNKKVLELGAGTGLCGIVLAKIGAAQVVMTDGCAVAVRVIENNIRHNEVDRVACAEQLTWGNTDARNTKYEVCVGTDIVYEPEAVRPLMASVGALLAPGGIFYLANHTHRFAALEPVVLREAQSFNLTLVESCSLGEGIDLRVFQAKS